MQAPCQEAPSANTLICGPAAIEDAHLTAEMRQVCARHTVSRSRTAHRGP